MARIARNKGVAFYEFSLAWAREVLRVLKPGGHIAAFSSTRTYHRMACAIEDAGFEIRDQLAWTYGQGFPKSHDVSKGIDNHEFGVWLDVEPSRRAAYLVEITAANGDAKHHVERKWRKAAGVEREVVGSKLGMPGYSLAANDTDAHGRKAYGKFMDAASECAITAPATDAARQWEGWGSNLKPSWEPICLARKPLSEKTIAANVLRWGTGAINIDGCRVPTDEILSIGSNNRANGTINFGMADNKAAQSQSPLGRFPANLCHDGSEEVLAAFPVGGGGSFAKSGHLVGGKSENCVGLNGTKNAPDNYGDSGSAARFFYSAKASKADRALSKHPTVKPVKLMQWLCRMLTPPGGTVLDMFAGSGTTGMAARLEGFNCILIERELEYIADIRNRMGETPMEKPEAQPLADSLFSA